MCMCLELPIVLPHIGLGDDVQIRIMNSESVLHLRCDQNQAGGVG